jgi:hypothetical protein
VVVALVESDGVLGQRRVSSCGSLAVISSRLTQIQPSVPSKRIPLRWPFGLTTAPKMSSSFVVLMLSTTPFAYVYLTVYSANVV